MTENRQSPTKARSAIVQIIKFIKDRKYDEGDRLLSERHFAEKFNITRQAVREAITTLETLRVVERRRNSGIYLKDFDHESSIEVMVQFANADNDLDRETVQNSLEIRLILEVNAVQLAAERRTEADLEALHAILTNADAKIEKGLSIAREDEAFHLAIIRSTKNSLYSRVVNTFYALNARRRVIYFKDPEIGRISQGFHWKILAAIEAKDADLARRLMNDHLKGTAAIWDRLMVKEARADGAEEKD